MAVTATGTTIRVKYCFWDACSPAWFVRILAIAVRPVLRAIPATPSHPRPSLPTDHHCFFVPIAALEVAATAVAAIITSAGCCIHVPCQVERQNLHPRTNTNTKHRRNTRKTGMTKCICLSWERCPCDTNDMQCARSTMVHRKARADRLFNLYSAIQEINRTSMCDCSSGIRPPGNLLSDHSQTCTLINNDSSR